ncbi:MAG: hypothetical protein GQ559_04880 [Desulfobulbaceae bacterium]|nr:hypothetical protein [Desulfobulbaceae bacterium]
MNQDIEKMLSFEVKKEIADRYFGFRKLIEDDILDYDSQVIAAFRRLEQKIGFALVRIYILLKDERVIHDFFQVIGLKEKLFFDPYLTESPTIKKRVFTGQQPHGLTRKSRFRNMVTDTYESIAEHIDEYRVNLKVLAEEQEVIAEEIRLFYQKNDLSTIMGFLRGLGGSDAYKSGAMEGGLTPRTGESLEEKMLVTAPPPVDELLPILPEVAPLGKIKGKLKPIIDRAFELQGQPEMRDFIC